MTTLDSRPEATSAVPGFLRGPGAPAAGAADTLARARRRLVGLQHPDGWWKAELETNVTMDAEDLMLRHFLGVLDPEVARASAVWIRSNRRSDGTWATFFGGPPDLSTTIEAYVALRLAGDRADSAEMKASSDWVAEQGGIAASRVFTRIWLALFGAWDWEDLPVLPPEIMLLPSSFPLNIYDFGCWARQTVVALTVVMSLRPVRPLPFGLSEFGSATPVQHRSPISTRAGQFELLDRILHRYERLPAWFLPRRFVRRVALRRSEQWIIQRQEADGLWGGIQPPVVYSIMALNLLGYPLDHPCIKAAFDGLDGFTISDERGRRIEACQSPVWDTALAVVALGDSGSDEDDPAVTRGIDWLLREEIRVKGDWAVRRPDLPAGGWAFEFENDSYPDVDDTAEVILALRQGSSRSIDAACRRGVEWTLGMQSKGGGWGAFDVDNDSRLVASLPFCDFGEVTDPPSADVTAHVVEMLAGEPNVPPAVLREAIDWLWAEQESDGSWFGRWGVNYVYGTGAAVPALIAAGVLPDDSRIRRAVAWLEVHQNDDGGWGEDLRSYIDPAWKGRGASTASQTAWALLALLAAGERHEEAVARGVQWLIEHQDESGTWEEPWFTGTGFPWDFSINYHLYRLVWPVMALGRYLGALPEGSRP